MTPIEQARRIAALAHAGTSAASAPDNATDPAEPDLEGADKQLMQTVMLRLAEAFETAKVPLVPQIQLGAGGGEGNAFSTLLTLMSSMKARELAHLEGPTS